MPALRKKIWLAVVLLVTATMVSGFLWIDGLLYTAPQETVNEKPVETSLYSTNGQSGEQLFKANCTSCHTMNKTLTGPALNGVNDRMSDTLMENFLLYPEKTIKHSTYLRDLVKRFDNLPHPSFSGFLTKQDIANIIMYFNEWKPMEYNLPVACR